MLEAYLLSGGAEIDTAGGWIDLGAALQDTRLVERGIHSLSEDDEVNKPYTLYNLGNAHKTLFDITRAQKGNNYRSFTDNKHLLGSSNYFNQAEALGHSSSSLYTNYASALSTQGRYMEAIEFYDRVLKNDPCFGMAYGNKAICVKHMAAISGDEHMEAAQLVYAYQLLQKAFKYKESVISIGGTHALEWFKAEKHNIEIMFKDTPEELKSKLQHEKFDLEGVKDKILRGFHDFSIKNDLFLNLHVQDKNTKAALYDPVFISMVYPIK